jgi:hypothetical protein
MRPSPAPGRRMIHGSRSDETVSAAQARPPLRRYLRNGALLVGGEITIITPVLAWPIYREGGFPALSMTIAACVWLSVSGMAGGWVYWRLAGQGRGYYARWTLSALAAAASVLLVPAMLSVAPVRDALAFSAIMGAVALVGALVGGPMMGWHHRNESP